MNSSAMATQWIQRLCMCGNFEHVKGLKCSTCPLNTDTQAQIASKKDSNPNMAKMIVNAKFKIPSQITKLGPRLREKEWCVSTVMN